MKKSKNKSGISPIFLDWDIYIIKYLLKLLLGEIPQLNDELIKGYDRLSAGFSLKQSLTIYALSKNKKINFHLGLEVIESWTKDLRVQ